MIALSTSGASFAYSHQKTQYDSLKEVILTFYFLSRIFMLLFPQNQLFGRSCSHQTILVLFPSLAMVTGGCIPYVAVQEPDSSELCNCGYFSRKNAVWGFSSMLFSSRFLLNTPGILETIVNINQKYLMQFVPNLSGAVPQDSSVWLIICKGHTLPHTPRIMHNNRHL